MRSSKKMRWSHWLFTALIVALAASCGPSEAIDPDPDPNNGIDAPPLDPEIGASDFVSADPSSPSSGREDEYDGNNDTGSAEPPGSPDDGADREVEEGDIYRLLSDGLMLNLNSYRGLQIIDTSDLMAPRIVGRAQMSGHPVELYAVGDKAVVLLNNWSGYSGSRFGTTTERRSGGLVVTVDLSDRANPTILGQHHVPGYIQTSRVVRDANTAALYVAASDWSWDEETNEYGSRTTVKSFDVSTNAIVPRTELTLGGYVTDIQATPTRLLVARGTESWWESNRGSTVMVVDISNPDGTMRAGQEVEVKGRVFSQFNMDLYKDVLRVVSGSRWGSNRTNYIQTFDASDIDAITAIDEETFGAGEDLYATLFRGNKAFFVTYFRVDPFHAFEITDEGIATEKSEFIVSGWNDFFRAVHDDTRLIGIGINDEDGQTLAVSLYDITDLENAEPMIERKEVEAKWSWSEANWDHRAFSVIEDAVSVLSEEGVEETGLVLLPFSGYAEDENGENWRYRSAVQIFTFSDTTLTARGAMEHPSIVRRSFLVDDDVAGNLSEIEFALYDIEDLDAPEALGKVELAPNYTELYVFGSHRARVKDPRSWYYWDWDASQTSTPKLIEVIPGSVHPDVAEPVATLEIHPSATLRQVGNLLVAMHIEPRGSDSALTAVFEIFDLSNPAQPDKVGDYETTELVEDRQSYNNRPGYDCWDCGRYYGSLAPQVVDDALVFTTTAQKSRAIGTQETCWTRAVDVNQCWGRDDYNNGEDYYGPMNSYDGDDGETGSTPPREEEREDEATAEPCELYTGDRYCSSLNGGPEQCYGEFQVCTVRGWNVEDCSPVAASEIETRTECSTREVLRYWRQYRFHVLDLSTPSSPVLGERLEMDADDEGVATLTKDSALYYTYQQPVRVSGDPRGYVRSYFRKIDLSRPLEPEVGPGINIPGVLVAVEGDRAYTRDYVYGEHTVETAVAKVRVEGDRAYLEGRRRFADSWIGGLTFDEAGHFLITHRRYDYYGYGDDVATAEDGPTRPGEETPETNYMRMSILDTTDANFAELANVPVDNWASLRAARPGRAFFQAGAGLLVFNIDDASSPYPQAYFPIQGWPQHLVLDGRDVMFTAGRYGIYQFSSDTHNLLTEE